MIELAVEIFVSIIGISVIFSGLIGIIVTVYEAFCDWKRNK
jgi:hypothetical protein